MNHKWQDAAKQHGGKHEAAVTGMHEAISMASPQTVDGRTKAAWDFFAGSVRSMQADGSTLQDGFDALQHLVDHRSLIEDAVEHGV